MRVVEESVVEGGRSRGKYADLYDGFAELPRGEWVEFVGGEDFDGDPRTFSRTFRGGMGARGVKVEVRVRGSRVYARTGPAPVKQVRRAPRPQKRGDGDSSRKRGDGDAAARRGDGDASRKRGDGDGVAAVFRPPGGAR